MTTHLSVQKFVLQSEERVGGRETDVKKHHESTAVVSNPQTLKKQLDENSELDVDQDLNGNIEEDIIGESGALKGPGQSKTPDESVGGISNRDVSSHTKKFVKNGRQSP